MIKLEGGDMGFDPDRETKLWANNLAEIDRRLRRYQEMAADDLITFDELRARLVELDDMRISAEQELRALHSRKEDLDELEHDRDVSLDNLTHVARRRWRRWPPKTITKSLNLHFVQRHSATQQIVGGFAVQVNVGVRT
jgi:hypothetical protein